MRGVPARGVHASHAAHGATILDGRMLADQRLTSLAARVHRLRHTVGRPPCVAVVQVGAHPESEVYVAAKRRAAERVGAEFIHRRLPASCSMAALNNAVKSASDDERVDGVILQLPLPYSLSADTALGLISPDKDVDGFCPANVAALASTGRALNVPCTPRALMALLESTGKAIEGAHTVVIGRGRVVGLPAALMLMHRHATVSVAHSRTRLTDLEYMVRHADIVVAAAGKPELVSGAWIKAGAVVLDVGITREAQGALQGDVQFDEAAKRASYITPVPGGVGPMTVAMLLQATVEALERRAATAS